ncbi:hypothetical protein EV649_6573 [Kribbella sp. VKM Ac-2569]|uniref:hypothetical protein n=1 Tax=Kribbella sp. VKM Ac-2569 TaxID=2512220 RepID=UPI0010E4C95A|nr:hypothetical protein [Kribbella sp. VKM Ac-2569]RZT13382.1 hypothetical protein EV649_6573 [Kribbella sp. VKM Ac-2569]
MQRDITVPFTVVQDENGAWCAAAALSSEAFANGEGDTRDAAIADLREAIALLVAETGIPDQLTVTVETD